MFDERDGVNVYFTKDEGSIDMIVVYIRASELFPLHIGASTCPIKLIAITLKCLVPAINIIMHNFRERERERERE